MGLNRLFAIFCGCLLALWFFSKHVAAAQNPIEATLELVSKEVSSVSEGIAVRVTINNTSNSSQRFLRWYTPFEGIKGDIFRIKRNEEFVPYVGRLLKRSQPTTDDYMIISPETSITETIELSGAYDLTKSGEYSISLQTSLQEIAQDIDRDSLAPKMSFRMQKLRSNTVSVRLEGSDIMTRAPKNLLDSALAASRPRFDNCNNNQKRTINAAHNASKTISNEAVDFLDKKYDLQGGKRYRLWFGTFANARYTTVKSKFTAIANSLANDPITFNCDCQESAFAYVVPNRPYDIWLCQSFWVAPLLGRDSQSGTLVHEISHFSVVAGTRDEAYGETNAKRLASNEPEKAVRNAENYEYFSENVEKH